MYSNHLREAALRWNKLESAVSSVSKMMWIREPCRLYLILFLLAEYTSRSKIHLPLCKSIPQETKAQIEDLEKSSNVPTTRQYWIDSAKALGIEDTPGGLRFTHNVNDPTNAVNASKDLLSARSVSRASSAGKQEIIESSPKANYIVFLRHRKLYQQIVQARIFSPTFWNVENALKMWKRSWKRSSTIRVIGRVEQLGGGKNSLKMFGKGFMAIVDNLTTPPQTKSMYSQSTLLQSGNMRSLSMRGLFLSYTIIPS